MNGIYLQLMQVELYCYTETSRGSSSDYTGSMARSDGSPAIEKQAAAGGEGEAKASHYDGH